jgi:uncharacterized protein YegP (UPF0339 family)
MPTKNKRLLRFEYWKSVKNKQWYWRLKAGNNEPIAQSEGYKTMRGVLNAYDAIFNVLKPVAVDINAEAVARFTSSVRGFPTPKKLAKKPKRYEGHLNRNWP